MQVKDKSLTWFVQPYMPSCDSRVTKTYNPLYEVELPKDIGRFVLVDDPEGFDVMFKYRGRWRSLCGVCWFRFANEKIDRHDYWPCSVVAFGRRYLRERYNVKEMTWKQWTSRK